MNFWLELGFIIAGTALGTLYGYQVGHRDGFNACDFEHDFDRCPHCGEHLDPPDDDLTRLHKTRLRVGTGPTRT